MTEDNLCIFFVTQILRWFVINNWNVHTTQRITFKKLAGHAEDYNYHVKHIVVITLGYIQYIPRNMHTVFALLYFVVVIPWLIFPYQSGLLHWHCGNLTIAPVPASASKETLMNMDKYFIWIHYERLHNHNKAKHNKTVSIFLGIYCT